MPHSVRILAFVLIALMGTACSTNRKPRYDMEDGQSVSFRRYTGRPCVDHIFKWSKKAFHKVDGELSIVPSEDANEVLQRHGKPDYIRTDVQAEGDEIFDEWVYWDQNVILQFIDGQLVYEGELLDSDKVLVRRGYPSRAYSQQYEIGPRREFWIYQDLFEVGEDSYSFSNGKMIFQSTN
ncbi:MAG: hypothetical protein PWP23_417 [Candidatus Sumerlaeota bacterium]|nr:hypothetical protein [Candidatus Sumerlaeota bacterium]